MTSIDEFKNVADSINLSKIGEKPFTIIAVEDSDYTNDKGEVSLGVKITTKEKWGKNDNDEEIEKIHTTRRAIVNKLRHKDKDGNDVNQKLHEALANGDEIGPVKCPTEKIKPKGKGLPYFDLVQAE